MMAHTDMLKDTETHFIIDPGMRTITNAFEGNNIIVQHDHNSERFTFEIPRYVDGHDMLKSTDVRVHYRNSASTGLNKTEDVYSCIDLALSEEDKNIVTFSWLLSSSATQYIGYLYFSIEFLCIEGEKVEYSWNTGVYKDITIIESINNTDQVSGDITDALTVVINQVKLELADYDDIAFTDDDNGNVWIRGDRHG